MTYPALPDRHMPYDNDGTVAYYNTNQTTAEGFANGPATVLSQANLASLNSVTTGGSGAVLQVGGADGNGGTFFVFFPEQREVTGIVIIAEGNGGDGVTPALWGSLQGSATTTNGVDGTWETATVSNPVRARSLDSWRTGIQSVSFTGAKVSVRFSMYHDIFGLPVYAFHLYGEKAAGQTPQDLLFLDAQNADAQFTAPIDFGDRPLGTTVTHQFKVQNASATKTANSINLQCNDADFAISTDGVTYVATINITSLAASAKSAVMYVRDTTPNPGGALGPRYARIVATVASYT